MLTDQGDGYDTTVLIKCTTKDGASASQKVNLFQASKCLTTWSESSASYDKSFAYTGMNKDAAPSPMANMLGTTDNQLCAISSCELVDGMKETKYTGGGVSVNSISYDISFKNEFVTGYDSYLKMKCTNPAGTKTSKAFTVKQKHACTATLAQFATTEDIKTTFERSSKSTMHIHKTAPMSNYLTSDDETNCPLTTCWTWNADKDISLSSETVFISSQSTKPYNTLNYRTSDNTLNGYVQRLRIKCSNGVQEMLSRPFSVTQTGNKCVDTMSINKSVLKPIDLDYKNAISYSASTDLYDAGNWGARFTNSEPTDCASTCSVLDSNCKASGDSRVSIDM